MHPLKLNGGKEERKKESKTNPQTNKKLKQTKKNTHENGAAGAMRRKPGNQCDVLQKHPEKSICWELPTTDG